MNYIYQSLFVQSLPIKYQAAISLSKMLSNETATEFLKPHLHNILEVYLRIMEEIDSEELMSALEGIVEGYSEEIGPFAVQLSQQLVNKYHSLTAETEGVNADEHSDGEEEKMLAAAACVTAIRRIVDACSKDKNGLRQILPIIYPILAHSLTEDGLDVIDEGLDCINILIYNAYDQETRVPVELWKLLPRMIFITAGNDNDVDGGFCLEQLS